MNALLFAQEASSVVVTQLLDRPSESDCNTAFFMGFFTFMGFGVLAHALYLSRRVTEVES